MAWSNHHFGVAKRLGDWRTCHRSLQPNMMYSHFYHAIYATPDQALARTLGYLAKKFPDYDWKHVSTDEQHKKQLFVIVCEGTRKCCTQPS